MGRNWANGITGTNGVGNMDESGHDRTKLGSRAGLDWISNYESGEIDNVPEWSSDSFGGV